MSEFVELYRRHRPTKLSEVIGQKEAISALVDMGKRGEIPHAILFKGPSGTGKTTLARILRDKLKCSESDFMEINAASSRGIDTIRDISRLAGSSPLGGSCRIWLIDEAHALTKDAQDALLKLLEDPPNHAYFFLATTDPQKLKTTILTRCTAITCKLVSDAELKALVIRISKLEEIDLDEEVASKIAEVSEGSARKALVVLHSVIGIKDKKEQLNAVQSADIQAQAFEIARGLMSKKTTWSEMAKLLKTVEEEPETIRWMILSYCTTVITGNGDHARAARIIEEFRDNFYDSKKAGLAVSCYNVIAG